MKRLTRRFLDEYGWTRITIGSSVVTFCEQCERQRTHTCIARTWEDDDWVYDFECDHCMYDRSKT